LTVSVEVPGVDAHVVAVVVMVVVVEGDVVVEVLVVVDEVVAVVAAVVDEVVDVVAAVVDEVVDVVLDEVVDVVLDEVVDVIGAATQEVAMVLLSMVTSPVFAKAAPCRVVPVASVTLE
jgi:hypothetical protein